MAVAETSGTALVWFRRDLRDYDRAALHAALASQHAVHCGVVFDTETLDARASGRGYGSARAAGGWMRDRPRLSGTARAPRACPAAHPRAIRGVRAR